MGVVDSYIRFTLRIPEETHEALQKLAKHEHRSLNSQIIAMLEKECREFEGELFAKTQDETKQ